MAIIESLPFRQDDTIYQQVDWQKFNFYFYDDEAQTSPTNFSQGTFQGEALDKEGGTKIYDLTFNTPSDSGQMFPTLTDTQTTTLTGRTIWFWATFTDSAGIIYPYFFGELTISSAFVAGA
jgi:hypothetical protein